MRCKHLHEAYVHLLDHVTILRWGVYIYLDKEWNGVESSDDNSVVDIPGQDVQRSCAAFHYFLHTYTLLNGLKWGERK